MNLEQILRGTPHIRLSTIAHMTQPPDSANATHIIKALTIYLPVLYSIPMQIFTQLSSYYNLPLNHKS